MSYDRLLHLTRMGDLDAARALQREARRRGDWPVFIEAFRLLEPGVDIEGVLFEGTLELFSENLDRYAHLQIVTGDLILSPRAHTNLSALSQLETVGGRLVLQDCPSLTHVELPSLTHVSELLVRDNVALQRLELPALERAHLLHIEANPALILARFPNLTSLTAGLYVEALLRLESLELPTLTQTPSLHLTNLPWLSHLTLPALEHLDGHGTASDNAQLKHISAPLLSNITGDLRLERCPITTLHLPHLERVGGALHLTRVQSEPPLTLALPHLVSAAELIIDESSLAALELPQLTVLNRLSIADSQLSELQLPKLREVRTSLRLSVLPELESLYAPALVEVGYAAYQDALALVGLPQLADLELPALERISGHFDLLNNPRLASVEMPLLERLDGYLNAHNNKPGIRINVPDKVTLIRRFRADFHNTPQPSPLQKTLATLVLVMAGLTALTLLVNNSPRRYPAYQVPHLDLNIPPLPDPLAMENTLHASHALGLIGVWRIARSEERSICDILAEKGHAVHEGNWTPEDPVKPCIRGSVIVRQSEDRDLRALAGIYAIEGDLIIDRNPALSELKGIEFLSGVGGTLVITRNPLLREIELRFYGQGLIRVHIAHNLNLKDCPLWLFAHRLDGFRIEDNAPEGRCTATRALELPPPTQPLGT